MTRTLEELSQYLVGHWKLDGDFKDSSGNGNHGVPTDVEWKPTERGMKPHCYGSVKYFTSEFKAIGTKDFTLSFRVKKKSVTNYDVMVMLGESTIGSVGVIVYNPGIRAYMYDVESTISSQTSSTYTSVDWMHYLVTFDRDGDMILFIDGVKQNETDISSMADLEISGMLKTTQLTNYGNTSGMFEYDDIRVYVGTIFSDSEVELLYNSTKHAYGVTPAERSFSHDVGSVLGTDENTVFATDMHTKNADGTLIDLSGSNLHLTTGNVGRDSGYFRDTMRFVSSGSFAGNETDFDNGTNLFSITALVRANNTGSPIVFNGRNSGAGLQADGSGYSLSIKDKSNIQLYWYKDVETTHSIQNTISTNTFDFSKYTLITVIIDTDANAIKYYVNGILTDSFDIASPVIGYYCVRLGNFNGSTNPSLPLDGNIAFLQLTNSLKDEALYFNKLARLPLYSLDFSKHPSNTTVYDDFLPYSSARIASGSFKVDNDKLECVTDGQIVFRNAHEFDGDEYIKLTINDTVYAGTGTITQGTTTASIEQGSTLITVDMVAGDTIDSIDIQFREPVDE
jgi:hypothetical protein